MPDFWVGTLLILYFSLAWGFLPPLGYVSLLDDPFMNLQQFCLPVMVLGLRLSATTARMVRANMLEVLRQDYVRTARAKGLLEGAVVYRHALKNALIPVLTILGTQLGTLLGGTVILETLFSLPGVGFLTFSSIGFRDYPQIQANVLFLSATLVFLNLLVDMSYSWLDRGSGISECMAAHAHRSYSGCKNSLPLGFREGQLPVHLRAKVSGIMTSSLAADALLKGYDPRMQRASQMVPHRQAKAAWGRLGGDYPPAHCRGLSGGCRVSL